MRTTLTIDNDIAQALKDLSQSRGDSFKAVVNEVLRKGLTCGDKPIGKRRPSACTPGDADSSQGSIR